ncbi:MAG: hypothetical protein ACI9DF_004139 [Verrucomicrobiales bacterium]|jgi:hypothetical protein
MEAAAEVWEDIIKDQGFGLLVIDYGYAEGTNGLANAVVTQTLLGRPSAARLLVDTIEEDGDELPWYFDPDPLANTHWHMRSALAKDLSIAESSTRFRFDPPEQLEVSYRGEARESAPQEVKDNYDLFTSVLHEMGHCLGMAKSYNGAVTEVADGDYDLHEIVSNELGTDWAALIHDGKAGHLEWGPGKTNNPLMCGDCAESGVRRLPSALDALAVSQAGGWTEINLPQKEYSGHMVEPSF